MCIRDSRSACAPEPQFALSVAYSVVKALTAYRYASQKKNFPFEIKKTVSLELWADLNRRPHPYQLVRSHPGLGFQGFPPFLLQKGEVSDTLISLVSVRSFSRVGQAAIPVCWIVCRKALSSSAAYSRITVKVAFRLRMTN